MKSETGFVRTVLCVSILLCTMVAAVAVASAQSAAPLGPATGEMQPAVATPQALQCFSQAGTYGNVTVTTSGAGCGNDLNFGGIVGMYIGESDTSESCTFSFNHPIDGALAMVLFTAHSCVTGGCEAVGFTLNGVSYDVQSADLDNANPPGGDGPVTLLPNGTVEGTDAGNGDGRATVQFNNASDNVTSIEINHVAVSGAPSGTVYQVCVDDTTTPVELQNFQID